MAFYHAMLNAFWQILKAPFVDLSVLWVLAPVALIWLILEAYFDTHKKEQLGWNTALGNGISMFWITVQLMQHLFSNHFANFTWPKFLSVMFILLFAMFVSYISFTHKFSSKVTYMIASPTPVYFLSAVAILWAYGSLTLNLWVLIDLVLFFGIILGIVGIFRKLAPESDKDEEEDSGSSDLGSFDKGEKKSSDSFASDDFTKEGESLGSGGKDEFDDFKF